MSAQEFWTWFLIPALVAVIIVGFAVAGRFLIDRSGKPDDL
jgi:hypothetical protein